MKAGTHSLVQNPADENAVLACPIKNDVLLMLDSPISLANSIAGSSNFGGFGKLIEAGFQAIEIALRLLRPPGIHGVIGDIHQI